MSKQPSNIEQPAPTLALGLVRRDGGTQPRDQINAKVAKEYAEAIGEGAALPAVTVFYDGTDYWLADGFHRAAAHDHLGLCDIAADIRQGTRRDAIIFSVGANASHGYRRSSADKRRAVLTLLHDTEWSAWSDREIARRCAVTGKTVAALRPEASAEIPQIDRTVERNGKTYNMNTSAIGKKKADDTAEKDMEATKAVGLRPGPRALVPDDGNIIDLCRKGIALEESGHTTESAAAETGLSASAYRISRQIVFLADRIDLAGDDAAIMREAFDLLATTQQYGRAWEIAQPVAVKVWGDAARWERLTTLAARRIEQFERTFGIVLQSCLTTEEIDLPYLPTEQVNQFTKEIGRARRALAAFSDRIKEIRK